MDDREARAALVNDLLWQVDQLKPRGIEDNNGKPYDPAYYKRGLQKAIDRRGSAVADFVRQYLYKAPSDGYKKLKAADSLDLACEALVADEEKPYAHLFTDEDRETAKTRLGAHLETIEARKAATRARIDADRADLPSDLEQLRELAARTTHPEDTIAINARILRQAEDDTAAMNRLGRGYEAIGSIDAAVQTFRQAVEVDPSNAIAVRRLRDLAGRDRR